MIFLCFVVVCCMSRHPPIPTRSDTLLPYPSLFRSIWLRYNPTVATLTNSQISLPRNSLTTGLYIKTQAANPQTQKFLLLSMFCTAIYADVQKMQKIGRASCRERVCRTCRYRWSQYH